MVYFVGAGSGASDLITVRGKNLLEKADVIIYAGSLVNPELLTYAKEGCEIHNSAYMTLDEVIAVMENAQKAGKTVVRLHTGEPSIYGAVRELTGIAVRRDVAMTGEITLRGRVLAIGGLREKTMAAYLAGVKTIILPEENRKDEDEILPEVKENVKIVYISNADEAIKLALCAEPKAEEKPCTTEEKTEQTYVAAGESHGVGATIEAVAAE